MSIHICGFEKQVVLQNSSIALRRSSSLRMAWLLLGPFFLQIIIPPSASRRMWTIYSLLNLLFLVFCRSIGSQQNSSFVTSTFGVSDHYDYLPFCRIFRTLP